MDNKYINLELAVAENAYYQNTLRAKVNQSSDPEFLRQQAFEFLDMMKKGHEKKGKIAGKVQELLSWTILLTICSLAIAITEIVVSAKNGRHQRKQQSDDE